MTRVIRLAMFQLMLVLSSFLSQAAWAGDCDDLEYARSELDSAQSAFSSAADDLEFAASRLSSCASSEDSSDDCSSEMYQAQSAHSDYESAASSVESAESEVESAEYDVDDECY